MHAVPLIAPSEISNKIHCADLFESQPEYCKCFQVVPLKLVKEMILNCVETNFGKLETDS